MNLVDNSVSIIEDIKNKNKAPVNLSNINCIDKILGCISKLAFGTHVPKYTHPDSKSSVLNVLLNSEYLKNSESCLYASTGNSKVYIDATNNAAWLVGAKFLLTKDDNGNDLYSYLLKDDCSIFFELFQKLGIAQKLHQTYWDKFKDAIRPCNNVHVYAHMKQFYFPKISDPVDDKNDYFLLIPMYSSSFVHNLYSKIKYRTTDEYKEIKDKYRKNDPSEGTYMPITKLGILSYGGTQPQNTSFNNSLRQKSYLLSNLPPIVKSYSWNAPNDKRCRDIFSRGDEVNDQLTKIFYLYEKHNKLNNKKSYQTYTLNVAYLAIDYLQFLEEHLDQITDFSNFSKTYQNYFCYLKDRSLCKKDELEKFIDEVVEFIPFVITKFFETKNINIDDEIRSVYRNIIEKKLRNYIYNE